MVAAAVVQTDPALVAQMQRLATTHVVLTVAVVLIAVAALAVAVAAILGFRKLMRSVDARLAELTPKVEPLLASASKVAHDAEHVAGNVKQRVEAVLETIEDLNGRLKSGADAVETRVKKFGAVVDVVQSEAEDLLLDAASTAHGVHAAAEVLRSEKRRLQEGGAETDEDLFTD